MLRLRSTTRSGMSPPAHMPVTCPAARFATAPGSNVPAASPSIMYPCGSGLPVAKSAAVSCTATSGPGGPAPK